MSRILEIRWHSRAGLGAVTAANTLAEIAILSGFYAQAFPEFGAEKRGAPIKVFNRISEKEILIKTSIEKPNLVILLDPTLIGNELTTEEILEGLSSDGTLIINSEQQDSQFDKIYPGKVYYLPASTIARKHLNRDLPNLPMLAALIKLSGFLKYEESFNIVQKMLEESFSQNVAEANLKAFEEGYETLKA